MEIVKVATDWAKDEVFSSKFFIFFGIMFLVATLGFWQLGRTEIAKAFIYPTLIAGILLLTVGCGLFFSNLPKVSGFTTTYADNHLAFVKAEIIRTEKIMRDYENIVFKVIPVIIILASLLIIFIDKPIWRAISITIVAMMACILFVDTNANERVKNYNKQLLLAEKNLLK